MKSKIQGWKIAKQRSKKNNRIPPFVPSKNEVIFYENYINKVVNDKKLPKRALILGATPELRDSAIKAGLESYAVDISQEMMNKFSSLMKYKNHSLDKKIIKSWLKMKFPKNYFGIIMGDASLNNLVTRKDNNDLIKICSKILHGGGYMVLRQVVYPPKYRPCKKIEKLLKDYRNEKLSWEDFFMELRVFIYKNKVYNKKTYQFSAAKIFKIIDDLFKNKILDKDEYQKINSFRNNIINTFYPEDKFVKMVDGYGFKFISKFHDKPNRFFKYLFMMTFKKN